MALPVISRGHMPEEERLAFHKHVCPPNEGGDNPDPQEPTITFARNLLVGVDLELPDGDKVDMWIIEDPDAPDEERRMFPSRTIRVPEFALVNARVGCQGNTHTIHWHGIEPTPMNDGVGKHSFEVSGPFIYQFQPRQGGTFFYHCHKNTTLHFEMGLYGMLIVDPARPGKPEEPVTYPTGGPGFAHATDIPGASKGLIRYDHEVFWVGDEIDSRWHKLGHNAFMQKCDENDPINPENFTQDGILNDFRADIFVVSGIPRKIADTRPITPDEEPPPTAPPVSLAAPIVNVGDVILARVLNAGYTTQEYTIHGIDSWIVAGDGHPFGVDVFGQYSRPIPVPAGTPWRITTARRNDFVIRAVKRGVFPVTIDFFHAVSNRLLYTAKTFITVQ